MSRLEQLRICHSKIHQMTKMATSLRLQPAPRRRKSRLSAAQRQRKREHEQDEAALFSLTLDVNDLRQQLRQLEEQRALHATRALVARQRFEGQAIDAAALFFAVFRAGFRRFSAREMAFLHARVAEDVAFGPARGFGSFLDQWRRYKLLFLQRVFRIHTIRIVAWLDGEQGGEQQEQVHRCVVECLGEFEGVLTREAIDVVFASAAKDEALAGRLEGVSFVCPTRTLMYFDSSGRVVDYDAHADFFAGLSQVEGLDPMDVVCVMANARISSDGSLVPAPKADNEATDSNARIMDDISALPVDNQLEEDILDPQQADADAHEHREQASRKRHSVAYLLS